MALLLTLLKATTQACTGTRLQTKELIFSSSLQSWTAAQEFWQAIPTWLLQCLWGGRQAHKASILNGLMICDSEKVSHYQAKPPNLKSVLQYSDILFGNMPLIKSKIFKRHCFSCWFTTDESQCCNTNFLKHLEQTNAHLPQVIAPEVGHTLTASYSCRQRLRSLWAWSPQKLC